MNCGKFAKTFVPIIALMAGAALSGCDGATVNFSSGEGKKLSELDLKDKAPHELVLAGPDEVRITTGDKLAITVEGDADITQHLRFSLDADSLGISREGKDWKTGNKVAIINVTMPAPTDLTMAGSGRIIAAALAPAASVTVAGSGTIETPEIASDSLDLTIAGSGNYKAGGSARETKITVAGSGSGEMDALRTDRAKVTIAGSGDVRFASDGEVDADIVGSGSVTVRGRARCTVSALGSGRLICENGVTVDTESRDEPAAPETPKP